MELAKGTHGGMENRIVELVLVVHKNYLFLFEVVVLTLKVGYLLKSMFQHKDLEVV